MSETPFSEPRSASEKLEEVREELARQLEEACRATANGETPETTGELRKLDDALLAAARTTEEMIALRSAARARRRGGPQIADGEAGTSTIERIREFDDANGEHWRVWAVTPGQATSSSPRNLGDLQNGWLAFESLSTGAKRRLVDFPADWMTMQDDELRRLLETAPVAPARKRIINPDLPSHD
ncbi:MAG: hypothetical protein HOQ09_08340 [Gemmatimonadaceae bacterium]|nr:hypothetical protein [Gemmatimonadaceae bacterium]